MLTPSYSELMDTIKQGEKLDARVTSRYTVVLAAAKRARQLTDGANPLTYAPTDRAVSIAVKEMKEGKLRIRVSDEMVDGNYERMIRSRYRNHISALSKDDLREDFKDNYKPDRYSTDDDDNEIYPKDSYAHDVDDDLDKDDIGLYEDNDDEDKAFDEE